MCGSLDVEISPTSNSVRRKVINNRYIEPLSMQEPNPYAPSLMIWFTRMYLLHQILPTMARSSWLTKWSK